MQPTLSTDGERAPGAVEQRRVHRPFLCACDRCERALGLVEVLRHLDALSRELVQEVGLQAGRLERPQQRTRIGGRGTLVHRARHEDVLQRDHVGLHADHLGDARDAP